MAGLVAVPMLGDAHRALREIWGFADYRVGQTKAIVAALMTAQCRRHWAGGARGS